MTSIIGQLIAIGLYAQHMFRVTNYNTGIVTAVTGFLLIPTVLFSLFMAFCISAKKSKTVK